MFEKEAEEYANNEINKMFVDESEEVYVRASTLKQIIKNSHLKGLAEGEKIGKEKQWKATEKAQKKTSAKIKELEEENEGLKAFESHCDEIEEDAKAIAEENAELKEKLDKIRKYLVYDIFDRFKYLENLLKISQETQEELSKRILEQQKTIGSAIKNQIEKILNKFK